MATQPSTETHWAVRVSEGDSAIVDARRVYCLEHSEAPLPSLCLHRIGGSYLCLDFVFKILFLIVCMSVVGMLPLKTKDNRVGGVGGGLELELPAVVSHLTWALEAALGYSLTSESSLQPLFILFFAY